MTNMEKQLVETMFMVANGYFKHPTVLKMWMEMELTCDVNKIGKKITLNFKVTDPRCGGFAYAWILHHQLHTVCVEISLLSRYSCASCSANERVIIEFFCGLKLIHEVAVHLAYRWTNGKDAQTPEKYGEESG